MNPKKLGSSFIIFSKSLISTSFSSVYGTSLNQNTVFSLNQARTIGHNHAEIQVGDNVVRYARKADYITLDKDSLFGTNPKVYRNLRDEAFQASQRTLQRVDNQINDIIAEGYEEGLGSRAVGQKITKRFNQLKTWESERIARTEIHSAHVEGMLQGYDDLDVQYYRWNTHIDHRTRDSHRDELGARGGQIIPAGGTFSNGLKYPGDKKGPIKEWVNCRCTLSPYLMPLDKIPPSGLSYFYEDQLVSIPGINDDEAAIVNQTMNLNQEIDKYSLTPKEQERYNFLQSKENLLFIEIREFKELNNKIELNDLHNKYIKEGKLPYKEAKRHHELMSDIDKENVISINELKGIKPKIRNIARNPQGSQIIEEEPITKTLNGIIYKNYTNDPEDIMKKKFDSYSKNEFLTSKEVKQTFKEWSDGLDGVINNYLDGNITKAQEKLNKFNDNYNQHYTFTDINQKIDLISNAINTSGSLDEYTILYRGESGDTHILNESKRFIPFSFDKDQAIYFAEIGEEIPDKTYVYEAYVHKDVKGFALATNDYHHDPQEAEFLTNKESNNFTEVSREFIENEGYWLIKVIATPK